MCFSPSSYALVVTASMFRVEVNESHGLRVAFRLPPYLAEHSNIRIAHEHLPHYIQAMSSMDPNDVLGVHERALPFGQVVIIVPIQRFPEKILFSISAQRSPVSLIHPYQTVQMM